MYLFLGLIDYSKSKTNEVMYLVGVHILAHGKEQNEPFFIYQRAFKLPGVYYSAFVTQQMHNVL